jgi:hypothetical protein
MASVAQGLNILAETFTNKGKCGPPNDTCMVWTWQMGPYGGADPASRIAIADVKRGRGLDEDRQRYNLTKAAAIMETLYNGGDPNPHAALTKVSLETDPAIAVRYGSSMPMLTADNLNFNKWVKPGVALSSVSAEDYVRSVSGLTQVATFPNGTSLVAAPDISGRTRAFSGSILASGSGSASATASSGYASTGPVSFDGLTQCGTGSSAAQTDEASYYLPSTLGGALNDSQATIPGLTLFADPMFNGVNTTLLPTGAGLLDAMQRGDLADMFRQSGNAADVSGIPESFYPYDQTAWGPAAGPAPRSALAAPYSDFASIPTRGTVGARSMRPGMGPGMGPAMGPGMGHHSGYLGAAPLRYGGSVKSGHRF